MVVSEGKGKSLQFGMINKEIIKTYMHESNIFDNAHIHIGLSATPPHPFSEKGWLKIINNYSLICIYTYINTILFYFLNSYTHTREWN